MQLSEKKRKLRMVYIIYVTIACFALLIARVFYLQIIQGPELVERALNQWTRETAVSAKRGSILDCNGEILAQSGSADTVLLHPKQINSSSDPAVNEAACQQVASSLAPILEMDEATILAKAKDTSKYEIWLKRQITAEQADQIRALNLKGVDFAVDTKRYYPKGDFLTQVLGFTSVDGEGLEGLEAYYNKYLTGTSGLLTEQTDVKGNEVAFGEQYYTPATDGYDVYLTIDYVIQSYVEKAAQDAYERYGATKVMCIAMDPQTGAILAMTSRPGYDLNDPPRDDSATLTALTRNTLLADSNDPGSVFKVFTYAAALDQGLTDESATFDCRGGREIGGGFIKCAHNHGSGLSLAEALAHSCNSAAMDLGMELGVERLYAYLSNFGFGQKTGVDFGSEASGIVIAQENVKDADLARIAFGQSITATPLQTLSAFCAVINGGKLYTPHFMQKITDQDGNVIEEYTPTVQHQVISEQTSERMRSLLQYVVDNGSGSKAAVAGYTVGGKTGTAQKYDENGQIKSTHLSSFMAFAPVEDPQIAVLFLVDEATTTTSDYGSQVAAPYVGQILEETLQYMKVEPKYTQEELQQQSSVTVPNVVGKTEEEARSLLSAKGLTAYISGTAGGTVVEQMPVAGETVKKGETVAITLKTQEELGPAEMVEVPDLIGKTKDECQQLLDAAGLNFYAHGEGTASWQNIKPGQTVETRTEIRVEFTDTQ